MSKSGNLTIVLQAGGESRRMGRSKATVPFLGEPLIWRGINRLLPLADEFIITTNEPENLDFLDDLVELGKVRLVTDEYDQRGALRGVYTAINAASNEYVALVACDMVFPSRNLISAELEALMEEETDVAVPKTKHGYEPFHAVYRRSSCLPVVREATEAQDEGDGDDATTEAIEKRLDATARARGLGLLVLGSALIGDRGRDGRGALRTFGRNRSLVLVHVRVLSLASNNLRDGILAFAQH